MLFMRAATLQDSRFSFTIFILDQPPLLPPPTTTSTTHRGAASRHTSQPSHRHRSCAACGYRCWTRAGRAPNSVYKTTDFPLQKRIKNDTRPLLFRPIGERGAIWPRLQGVGGRSLYANLWIKMHSRPLFLGPMGSEVKGRRQGVKGEATGLI